jgi:hypothetical protein
VAGWTFLTHHMRVLFCIARDPAVRIRDVAICAGLTERSAHRVVSELVEEGYLTRHKLGTRNYYEVHPDRPLRHPAEKNLMVGDVLAPMLGRRPASATRKSSRAAATATDGATNGSRH